MSSVVYYLVLFILLGGTGMTVANRKVDREVRRQRWLKFFTYILITGIVIISISYSFFQWISLVIVAGSLLELYKVNSSIAFRPLPRVIFSFIILLLVSAGFILFAKKFNSSFLLFIYMQVLIFDAFCQIFGQIFGKHKLVPGISPTKTIEGLIGGIVMCITCAVLTSNQTNIDRVSALFFALLTEITSFSGDIIASAYKRMTSVKDYSNWLPGQGGFLDRFDSFLMTGAVYYLVMQFL